MIKLSHDFIYKFYSGSIALNIINVQISMILYNHKEISKNYLIIVIRTDKFYKYLIIFIRHDVFKNLYSYFHENTLFFNLDIKARYIAVDQI